MGRPVAFVSVGSMYPVLYWCLVYVSIAPHFVFAADIDIYQEFADEVISRRIQHVLTEWRQNQVGIPQTIEDREVLPQFTFQFPDDSTHNYQSDFFAVPPSDPRYYQSEPSQKLEEEKRLDNEGSYQSLRETDNDQPETQGSSEKDDFSEGSISEANKLQDTESDDVSDVLKKPAKDDQDIVLIAIIAGCGAAAAAGVVALSVGWYKLHSNSKAAADIEYPAYGVTGPNKEITPTGDRRLAQSAQMYHYQHQKQQIIAMENSRANNERRGSLSEGDSDEENEEGDYTVYECPGLAATGELEVKNPLFLDDPTPATGNQTVEEPPASANGK